MRWPSKECIDTVTGIIIGVILTTMWVVLTAPFSRLTLEYIAPEKSYILTDAKSGYKYRVAFTPNERLVFIVDGNGQEIIDGDFAYAALRGPRK